MRFASVSGLTRTLDVRRMAFVSIVRSAAAPAAFLLQWRRSPPSWSTQRAVDSAQAAALRDRSSAWAAGSHRSGGARQACQPGVLVTSSSACSSSPVAQPSPTAFAADCAGRCDDPRARHAVILCWSSPSAEQRAWPLQLVLLHKLHAHPPDIVRGHCQQGNALARSLHASETDAASADDAGTTTNRHAKAVTGPKPTANLLTLMNFGRF